MEDEHLVWFEEHAVKPGHKITVEIIETETPDPAQGSSAAQERADDERAYFEHCKKAYFEMREKYDGAA